MTFHVLLIFFFNCLTYMHVVKDIYYDIRCFVNFFFFKLFDIYACGIEPQNWKHLLPMMTTFALELQQHFVLHGRISMHGLSSQRRMCQNANLRLYLLFY